MIVAVKKSPAKKAVVTPSKKRPAVQDASTEIRLADLVIKNEMTRRKIEQIEESVDKLSVNVEKLSQQWYSEGQQMARIIGELRKELSRQADLREQLRLSVRKELDQRPEARQLDDVRQQLKKLLESLAPTNSEIQ